MFEEASYIQNYVLLCFCGVKIQRDMGIVFFFFIYIRGRGLTYLDFFDYCCYKAYFIYTMHHI